MFAGNSSAQIAMDDALKSMPDSLMPYLSKNNRLDCIDFIQAGMKAEVRNLLDGKSELTMLTNRYAHFHLNAAVDLQLALLDGVDGQLICVVYTYGTDFRESVIRFYTTSWQSLPSADYVSLPAGMFTAQLGVDDEKLTVVSKDALDKPAVEGQKDSNDVQKVLNWRGNSFN